MCTRAYDSHSNWRFVVVVILSTRPALISNIQIQTNILFFSISHIITFKNGSTFCLGSCEIWLLVERKSKVIKEYAFTSAFLRAFLTQKTNLLLIVVASLMFPTCYMFKRHICVNSEKNVIEFKIFFLSSIQIVICVNCAIILMIYKLDLFMSAMYTCMLRP